MIWLTWHTARKYHFVENGQQRFTLCGSVIQSVDSSVSVGLPDEWKCKQCQVRLAKREEAKKK